MSTRNRHFKQRRPTIFVTLGFLACAGTHALAQNDACAAATPLVGTGVFPFDNSNATTDGLPHLDCAGVGGPQITNDIWYCWTAPCTGIVSVDTCGQTLVNTKIAVYTGCACPATTPRLLACDDDTCATQSVVHFPATAGLPYLIRIGTQPGVPGGPGSFRIVCPPNAAQPADFGDAPDLNPACATPGIGMYPTQYASTNALPGRDAPYHYSVGLNDYFLGSAPTYEFDAIQAIDCDWISGLCVGPCDFDNGPFILCLDPQCLSGVISTSVCLPCDEWVATCFGPYPGPVAMGWWIFEATRGPFSAQLAFANVAVDFDYSGTYGSNPAEWVLVDGPVPPAPFQTYFMTTGVFPVAITFEQDRWLPVPFWTRFTVSDEFMSATLPPGVTWDGSGRIGGYQGGETEDVQVACDPGHGCPPVNYCFESVGQLVVTLDVGDINCVNPHVIPLSSAGQPPTTVREFGCASYHTGTSVLFDLQSTTLQGFDPFAGPVILRERADQLSLGVVSNVEATPSGQFISGDSFFDVFAEVELPQLDLLLDTGSHSIRMNARNIHSIPPYGATYQSEPGTRAPLYVRGTSQQVGWLCDAQHTPTIPASLCLCRGDGDCNGHVGFSDIDYFVESIPDNQAGWSALYAARHGGALPPCTFSNNDLNGDGHVGFADIDPFVERIPSTCP